MDAKKTIIIAGGQTAVAKFFGIEPPSVQEWVNRGVIPPKRVLGVSMLTGWQVTPHQIDPVLYPNPADGLPVESEGGPCG